MQEKDFLLFYLFFANSELRSNIPFCLMWMNVFEIGFNTFFFLRFPFLQCSFQTPNLVLLANAHLHKWKLLQIKSLYSSTFWFESKEAHSNWFQMTLFLNEKTSISCCQCRHYVVSSQKSTDVKAKCFSPDSNRELCYWAITLKNPESRTPQCKDPSKQKHAFVVAMHCVVQNVLYSDKKSSGNWKGGTDSWVSICQYWIEKQSDLHKHIND